MCLSDKKMSNVNSKDNVICNYTFPTIIIIIIIIIIFIFKKNWQIRRFLMFRFFFSLLKKKYSCHLKHVCRNICELISYGLCYMVMMWCINLNQVITTHIKFFFYQNIRYIGRTLKKILHLFIYGPLIISIILFHIIWWSEHHLFCNTLRVQTTMRERKINACPNIKKFMATNVP